jgi:CheY-like chemotaxis protein
MNTQTQSQPHRDFMMPLPASVINSQTIMAQKRILVVDDSMVIRRTLSMKLKASGYQVLEAADGASAVSTIRREKPDLILLDISFPPDVGVGGGVAWDGFLIMGWIQRMEEAKNIPVFIITGGAPEQYKSRSEAAGAAAFFQKPIDNEQLLAAIREKIGEGAPPNPTQSVG